MDKKFIYRRCTNCNLSMVLKSDSAIPCKRCGSNAHVHRLADRYEIPTGVDERLTNWSFIQRLPISSFQLKVFEWVRKCFGSLASVDKMERNYRFIEEALELVQALGMTKEKVLDLVNYVYGRKIGIPEQEVGGVLTTLAALCSANEIDMMKAGRTELIRVNDKIEKIREKQKNKPVNSSLPQ